MPQNKTPFQFPEKISAQRKLRLESSLLLWRILQCQPEVRSGEVKILKHAFLREFKENEELFCELSGNLFKSINLVLQHSCRHHLKNFPGFVMNLSSQYRKELINVQSPGRVLAFDILFQVLQLLSMNPDIKVAESVIRQMGKHEPMSSLTDVDREMVYRNLRAYLFITKSILKYKTLREALENRDEILYAASLKFTEVQIYFLESMFRTFVGQILLSRKFKCDTLIVEWMSEYGFGPEHMMRIANYISYDCSFLQFRPMYRKAIRGLQDYTPSGNQPEDSDVYLLRTLSNFYTSWLCKTAAQVPA